MIRSSTRSWLQIIGYLLATTFVLVGTAALIAYGNGYSYDFQTGRLLHRGLIIIQSTPSGAAMTLRNKPISQHTPYRQTFVAGSYQFTLSKAGYYSWSKNLQVVPSQVTLADYVILLPKQIPTKTIGTYASISQVISSDDQSRLAFTGVTTAPAGAVGTAGVWSLDTGNNQQTRLYTPAPATATTPAETVTLLSWSHDSSHLLLRSQLGDKTSLIVVAANGTDQPVNVTDTLKTDAIDATFNPGNAQQLYWQSPDGLRRLDLGNQTISAPLAAHVAAYTFADGRILYVDNAKSPASLWVMDSDGGNKQELIPKLPASQAYEVAFQDYLGTPEAAVAAQDSHSTTLYSNLYDSPTTKHLPASGQHLLFSDSGQFLLQYDDSHVSTYDLQLNRTTAISPPGSPATNLSWFDDSHLEFNDGGHVVVGEFDGNYPIPVARADGLAPYSSADGKTLFITSPTTTAAGVAEVRIQALKLRQ